jgi:hypothetical protein
LNLTKPSAPLVAHDVASRIIALERAADCHQVVAEAMADNAHGFCLVLLKTKRRDVEFAHILVLDGDFSTKGDDTEHLTSIYHPQIEGKFTKTPAWATNFFFGCKD